ncbi:hypothetical protein HK098_004454 [Nowakowskiella sp. JEL0407]|nr:hypothetical protein HK098_004454 [Nowakowskiella sp. JEL0407]
MKANAKKLHWVRSWVSGNFRKVIYRAHGLGILDLAFDGKVVVTASSDKTCKVFDVRNGKLLRTLIGHDDSVLCVQIDKTKIVTGSMDSTIRLWSYDTGAPLASFASHKSGITCLKFTNSTIISGSIDQTIKIWQISSGTPDSKKTTTFNPTTHRVSMNPTATYLKKDAKEVVSRRVTLHGVSNEKESGKGESLVTGRCLRTLHGHGSTVKCLDFFAVFWYPVMFTEFGNCLKEVQVNNDHTSACLFAKTSTMISESTKQEPISSIHYDGKRLMLGTFSGTMYLYNVEPYDESISQRKSTIARNSTAVSKRSNNVKESVSIGVMYESLRKWVDTDNVFFFKFDL